MVFDVAMRLIKRCTDILEEGRGVPLDGQDAAISPGDMLAVYVAMGRLRASTVAMAGSLEDVKPESAEDDWKGFCKSLKVFGASVGSLGLSAAPIDSPKIVNVTDGSDDALLSDSRVFSAFQCCEYAFAALAGATEESPSERFPPEKRLESNDEAVDWRSWRDDIEASGGANSKLDARNRLLELDGALDQCMTSMNEFLRTNFPESGATSQA